MSTNDNTSELKQKCMSLFSSKNLFYNCGDELINQYKEFFKQQNVVKILDNSELVDTARNFFENNLNITLTSKVAYMHRNTLIYRIEKIKSLIGIDIRVFKEAVVFENILLFYNMFKDEGKIKSN